MRKSLTAAVIAAGLVLAGCGSDEPGSATLPNTSGVNSGTAVIPTIPQVSIPEVSIPEVSIPEISIPEVSIPEVSIPEISIPEVSIPEVSIPEVSSGGGGTVDDNTISWFTTVCGGLTEMQDVAGTLTTVGGASDPGSIDAAVAALQPLADSVNGVVSELNGLQAPSIPGGDQAHEALVQQFGRLGTALNSAITEFSALDQSDPAAIQAAKTKFTEEFQALLTDDNPLSALSTLDAPSEEVQAAIAAIPECQAMFG